MKKLYLLLILLLPMIAEAQTKKDYWPRFDDFKINVLSISPNGEMAVCGNNGVIIGKADNSNWLELKTEENYAHFDICQWVDNNTLLFGGFEGIWMISRDKKGKFQIAKHISEEYLDAIYKDPKGRIYYADLENRAFVSDDGCKTWQNAKSITDILNRENGRIFDMASTPDGSLSWITTENHIHISNDNFKTFTSIPTPLDQKAYNAKINDDGRVFRFRKFNNMYWVNIDHKILRSSINHVKWQLCDNINDFDVIDNKTMFVTGKSSMQILNRNLQVIQELSVPNHGRIHAVQGKIYCMSGNLLYQLQGNSFKLIDILDAKSTLIPDGKQTFNIDGSNYFMNGIDLIRRDANGRWYRYFTHGIDGYSCFQEGNNICIYQFGEENKLLSIDVNQKKVSPYNWPDILFAGKKVIGMEFRYESKGCFHHYGKSLFYEQNGDQMVFVRDSVDGEYEVDFGYHLPHTFKASDVQQLADMLDRARTHDYALEDRQITDADRKEYVDFINKFNENSQEIDTLALAEDEPDSIEIVYDTDSIEVDTMEFDTVATDEEWEIDTVICDTAETVDEIQTSNAIPRVHRLIYGQEINDPEYYLPFADKLTSLNDTIVNYIQDLGRQSSSTTVTTYSMKFTFEDGTSVYCYSDYDTPNYLFSPWTINYGKLKYNLKNLQIGSQIDKLTQQQFIPAPYNKKAWAIYQYARGLKQ